MFKLGGWKPTLFLQPIYLISFTMSAFWLGVIIKSWFKHSAYQMLIATFFKENFTWQTSIIFAQNNYIQSRLIIQHSKEIMNIQAQTIFKEIPVIIEEYSI